VLSIVATAMLILGGVLVIISLVLAIIWRVPSLIDELSGRKAKRHIERMRKRNLVTGSAGLSESEEFVKYLEKDNITYDEAKTSELGKRIADPYGTVGGIHRGDKYDELSERREMLKKKKELKVVVLEEQSSIKNKQEVVV